MEEWMGPCGALWRERWRGQASWDGEPSDPSHVMADQLKFTWSNRFEDFDGLFRPWKSYARKPGRRAPSDRLRVPIIGRGTDPPCPWRHPSTEEVLVGGICIGTIDDVR